MTEYKTEDYINYRIQRAKETILEVGVLIDNKLWNTAVNRLYYACFYAVSALLLSKGIKTSTHSGCLQKFGRYFIKTGLVSRDHGKHYTLLFENRLKGDYDDFVDFDKNTTLELFEPSKKLIEKIEELLKDQ